MFELNGNSVMRFQRTRNIDALSNVCNCNFDEVDVWQSNVTPCDAFFCEGDRSLVTLRFLTNTECTRHNTIRKKVSQFFGIDIANILEEYPSCKVEYTNMAFSLSSKYLIGIIFHCPSEEIAEAIASEIINLIIQAN